MKKILFPVLLLLAITQSLTAQRDETLFGRNNLDMTGFWYTNTNNFTFYEDDTEYFSGGKVAFEFNKNLFLGWAWQRLEGEAIAADNNQRFNLRHNGLVVAFSPNSNKVIHPYFSMIGGSGRLNTNADRDRVFVFQPAGGLELNVFRWFRIGAEAGYRFVTDVDQSGLSTADVSAPFAQLQFRFGFSWR